MKIHIRLFFTSIVICNICTAQYPASFEWPVTAVKDQKEQGPCNIFASAALVESWFKILYQQDISLSETHLYSPCGGVDAYPNSNIFYALNFLKNTGVVERTCIPYDKGNNCTTPQLSSIEYYGVKFGNSNTVPVIPNGTVPSNLLYNNDCGTPYCDCIVGNFPSYRYRVGDFQSVGIAAMSVADDLKRAVMNLGPIAIRMNVTNSNYPELHTGTNHAYLLYGWQSDGKWLLKDSWPNNPNIKNATAFNIVDFFRNGGEGDAYVIKNNGSNPAVYKQSYDQGSNSWNTYSLTSGCLDTAVSNAFAISSPSTITSSGVTISITNLNLLDNPTVEWSFQSTQYNAVVTFSPNPSTGTTTATGVVSGNGIIIAKIKRPNGLCETIRKYNVTVMGNNIPFTYTKTSDQCVGATRRIVYQVTSPYSIQCAWNFYPVPGSSYSTTISGCTFTMNYTSYPTSYGLLVNVTSSSFPGITSQATAGGPVLSCGGHRVSKHLNSLKSIAQIDIFPNPAKKSFTIVLPDDKLYKVVMTNIAGVNLFTTISSKTINMNVEKFSKGIYIIRITTLTGEEEITIRKVVIQ